jgi:hypothetical protein
MVLFYMVFESSAQNFWKEASIRAYSPMKPVLLLPLFNAFDHVYFSLGGNLVYNATKPFSVK